LIHVKGLVKYYGDHRAVAGVDFDLQAGHVVGFLGLNGAGKTTILRILAGDLEPSAGTVEVGGLDLLGEPEAYRRKVGFLPEKVPLYDDLTVREYLRYLGALRGVPGRELAAKIEKVSEQVAITAYIDAPILHLSHGFQKRLGIASAIIHDPPLVILDEAISGLDPVQIVEMRKLVRGLAGERTVLVSSHILTEISQTCDDILVIRDGRIGARGAEDELLERLAVVRAIQVAVHGDLDLAKQVVGEVGDVTGVEVLRSSDKEHVLSVAVSRDVRPDLARALVGADLDLLRLDRALGELESVFLELAQTPADTEGGA